MNRIDSIINSEKIVIITIENDLGQHYILSKANLITIKKIHGRTLKWISMF